MTDPVELRRRQAALRAALRDRGWAGAVLTSEANFIYLTGLRFDALWTSAARALVCVVPTDGPVHLLLPDFLGAEAVEADSTMVVVTYDPPHQGVSTPLTRLLNSMPPGPIGWERGEESRLGLSLDSVESIRNSMKDHVSEDVADLMWGLRVRKSPGEIAAITAAARAGSAAFEAVYAEGVQGRTERELARALAMHAIDNGADRTAWIAATSGPGSYHRFVAAPRDRTVERGDMFWADIGLTVRGYWTDFCRAAVAGPISAERESLQAAIISTTDAGIDRCLPGTPVAEVTAAMRTQARELKVELLGYGRLGHGIGLSSTEPPNVASWDPTILESGMVVTIEPALSQSSGLYCAEQVVHVTPDGPVVLTTAWTGLTEA